MKSKKTISDSKSDKIQKKVDCILINRIKSSQSINNRIPKQIPTHYVLKNCRADNGAIHNNNQSEKLKPICLANHIFHNLHNFRMQIDCVNCKLLLDCTNNENRHCEECLLFNLKVPGNCEEPGYGTRADNRACDRFKLNTKRS